MLEGDVVCDIQTDKAVMAMEASEEGVLAKHLIEENTTVKVNTLIALLAEDGEDWKQVAATGVSGASSAPAATVAEPAAVAAPDEQWLKPDKVEEGMATLEQQQQLWRPGVKAEQVFICMISG